MLYLIIEHKENLPNQAGMETGQLKTAEAGNKGRNKNKKTRSFAAYPLGWLTADNLWAGGGADTKNTRPIWLAVTSTEQQLRAFVANVQTGRKAELHESESTNYYGRSAPPRFEFLRSAGYRYSWLNLKSADVPLEGTQEYKGRLAVGRRYSSSEPKVAELVTAGGSGGLSSCTIYLPELFRVESGDKNPAQATFVMLCPTWWNEQELAHLMLPEQARLTAQIAAHLEMVLTATNLPPKLKQYCAGFTAEDWLALVPQAAYFAAYLEQRTPRPLVSSLAYYLQLYVAALAEGLAFLPHRTPAAQHKLAWASAAREQDLMAHHTEQLGTLAPVGFRASQASLNKLLAEQTRLYFLAQDRLPHAQRFTDTELADDETTPASEILPLTNNNDTSLSNLPPSVIKLPTGQKSRATHPACKDKSA